jgi:hypothetical protein
MQDAFPKGAANQKVGVPSKSRPELHIGSIDVLMPQTYGVIASHH